MIRHVRRVALSLVLFLAMASCGPKRISDLPNAPVQRFSLDEHAFAMPIPANYSRVSQDFVCPHSRIIPGAVTFARSQARVPQMLRLWLITSDKDLLKGEIQTFRLASSYTLRYTIDRDLGVGSGGTEGKLLGVIDFHSVVVVVECHDQSEWGPEPEWCLSYLNHLRTE